MGAVSLKKKVDRFNELVTRELLKGAHAGLYAHGVAEEDVSEVWVPGAFEVPLIADRLAGSRKYAAVICLGAVIRGETTHDQHIQLALDFLLVAFAARSGMRNKAYNVAADVANAWRFYTDWLGSGPATPVVYATSIVGTHGQAFEGFLHLAESTWELESRGPDVAIRE